LNDEDFYFMKDIWIYFHIFIYFPGKTQNFIVKKRFNRSLIAALLRFWLWFGRGKEASGSEKNGKTVF